MIGPSKTERDVQVFKCGSAPETFQALLWIERPGRWERARERMHLLMLTNMGSHRTRQYLKMRELCGLEVDFGPLLDGIDASKHRAERSNVVFQTGLRLFSFFDCIDEVI